MSSLLPDSALGSKPLPLAQTAPTPAPTSTQTTHTVTLRAKIPTAWKIELGVVAREQGQSEAAIVRIALRQFLAGRFA